MLEENWHVLCEGMVYLSHFQSISKYMDMNNLVEVVYLDFQNAFGRHPYQRLLSKFCSCGIREVLLWTGSIDPVHK